MQVSHERVQLLVSFNEWVLFYMGMAYCFYMLELTNIFLQLLVFDIYSVFKRVMHCDTFQRPEDTSTPLHILKGHKLLIPNRPTFIQLNKRGRLVRVKPTYRHNQKSLANTPRILILYNRQHPLVKPATFSVHGILSSSLMPHPLHIPFIVCHLTYADKNLWENVFKKSVAELTRNYISFVFIWIICFVSLRNSILI